MLFWFRFSDLVCILLSALQEGVRVTDNKGGKSKESQLSKLEVKREEKSEMKKKVKEKENGGHKIKKRKKRTVRVSQIQKKGTAMQADADKL